MLDVNVAFAVKALGTGFWCLCYFVMVLQGLTTGDAVFSPWPHKSMAYCIVWEALFSWAKPKTSSGEVVKASKAQAEMTRILFLAWMILGRRQPRFNAAVQDLTKVSLIRYPADVAVLVGRQRDPRRGRQ